MSDLLTPSDVDRIEQDLDLMKPTRQQAEQLIATARAMRAVVEAWETWAAEAEPHLKSQAMLAYVHGCVYTGPFWPREQGQAALGLKTGGTS